ncbi:MAG TPA: carboxypeptidase-like regulatory domain-containing protein [Thermoanaerobaculia bacterium]|nr:carboxypeptidase-like regulatory domain-containing protein [Thermoanaerobaculia bacterium]
MLKVRRRWALGAAVLVATSLAPPAGAGAEAVQGEAVQGVAVLADGGFVAGPLAVLSELEEGVDHVWIWSRHSGPRRVEPAEWAAVEQAPPNASPARLRILWPARSEEEAAPLEVIAAPTAMWQEVPEELLPRAVLAAGGSLELPRDGEPWRLRAAGGGDGTWWLDVAARQASVTLRPRAAPRADLLLVDAEGSPVAGARAEWFEPGRKGRVVSWGRSDALGRVPRPSLPDLETVGLAVRSPDHVPVVVEDLPSRLPAKIRLHPGVVLTGRLVAGESGEALAGGQVDVEAWMPSEIPWSMQRSTGSDGAGRWRLGGLPAGELGIVLRSAGRVEERRRVTAERGVVDLGTVTLHRAARLQVKVLDDTGRPVAGAELRPEHGDPVHSGGDGTAWLAEVSRRDASVLTIAAEGHLPVRTTLLPPFDAPVEVVLPRAFTLEARLVHQDATPVAEATVQVVEGASSERSHLPAGGRLRLDLAPGQPVRLVLAGAAFRELTLEVEAGEPGERRDLGPVIVEAGLAVTGRVLDGRSGEPLPGVRVWLPRSWSPDGASASWLLEGPLEVATDGEGRFRLGGLPPVPLTVRVEARGFARREVPVVPSPAEREIALGDLWLSEGSRVMVRVDLDPAEPPGEPGRARLDLGGRWQTFDQLTAPVRDGEAVFVHVPPGPALLTVEAAGALVCERQVEIAEPATELECENDALRLSGSVRQGGQPVAGGKLVFLPAEAGPTVQLTHRTGGGLERQRQFRSGRPSVDVPLAGNGSFTTRQVRPGRWQVILFAEDGAPAAPRWLELGAEERHLVLDFDGLVVEGRVLDSDGEAVPGARVRQVGLGAEAQSDPSGYFEIRVLAREPVVLQAHHRGRSSAARTVDLTTLPPRSVELVIEAGSRAGLSAQVTTADEEPVAGAWVFFAVPGRSLQMVTSGRHGAAVAEYDDEVTSPWSAAAWFEGRWAFAAAGGAEARLVLPVRGGTLAVESGATGGVVSLATPGVGGLHELLRRVGAQVVAVPSAALEIHGLPPGRYQVGLGGQSREVSVEAGERVVARFD